MTQTPWATPTNPYLGEPKYIRAIRMIATGLAIGSIIPFLLIFFIGRLVGYPSHDTAILCDNILLAAYFGSFCSCNLAWMLPNRLEGSSFFWCNFAPVSFFLLPLFF